MSLERLPERKRNRNRKKKEITASGIMTQDEYAALVGIGRVLKAVGLEGLCSIEVFGNTLIDCATPFSVQLGERTMLF
jgi:hypothetical protein